jgi:ATP-dependent Lon protease
LGNAFHSGISWLFRGKHPFWIDKLTPIQLATFDLDEYRKLRAEFSTDEWLDFMMRSMDYEPTVMERRLKLLFLSGSWVE